MKANKSLFSLAFLALALSSCSSSVSSEQKLKMPVTDEKVYNEKLAKKLGADEYGMHQYVMAFLKAGPNRSQDSTESANLMRAHLDNITKMADAGKLVVAGPFMDDGDIRGIYIFNVKTVKEAEALTKTDPAIQAGSLVMELHPWYGSAALMQTVKVHKKIAKTKI